MKIQIRRGVFETNSSSVHTLSICKKDKDYSNVKEITFGPNISHSYLENSVQGKINQIFEYMISSDSLSRFVKCKTKLERCLTNAGINVKFEFSEDFSSNYIYSEYEDVFDDLFSENDKTFTMLLLNFIFDKNSYTDVFDRDEFDIKHDLDNNGFVNYISD